MAWPNTRVASKTNHNINLTLAILFWMWKRKATYAALRLLHNKKISTSEFSSLLLLNCRTSPACFSMLTHWSRECTNVMWQSKGRGLLGFSGGTVKIQPDLFFPIWDMRVVKDWNLYYLSGSRMYVCLRRMIRKYVLLVWDICSFLRHSIKK